MSGIIRTPRRPRKSYPRFNSSEEDASQFWSTIIEANDKIRRHREEEAAAAASARAEIDSIENTRRSIYQLIEKMSDLHNFLHQDTRDGIGYEYHMPLYKSLGDTIRLLKSYKNTYERILYSTGQPPFKRNLVTQPGFILGDGSLFPITPTRSLDI